MLKGKIAATGLVRMAAPLAIAMARRAVYRGLLPWRECDGP